MNNNALKEELLAAVSESLEDGAKINFSAKDNDVFMKGIRDLNNGSDTINLRKFRPGTELFSFVEEVITLIDRSGIKGDEFMFNNVEYRTVALGDQRVFNVVENNPFVVSEIGLGNQGIRRQRLNGTRSITVETSPKAIRTYEHLPLLTAGRVSFSTYVDRVNQAIMQRKYEDIYNMFAAISATTPGMHSDLTYSGSYNEEAILDIIARLEAESGATPKLIGTAKALRKLEMQNTALVSNDAKSDLYNIGYYGKFYGYDTYRINSRFASGTRDFIFPSDKVFVLAGSDKPVKFVTEGEAIMDHVSALNNMDLTQEYWTILQWGVALLLSHGVGIITFPDTTVTPGGQEAGKGEQQGE